MTKIELQDVILNGSDLLPESCARYTCIQLMIEVEQIQYLLHRDEYELSGLCSSGQNCSIWISGCVTDCDELTEKLLSFIPNQTVFAKGFEGSCWISDKYGWNMGAIVTSRVTTSDC